MVITKASVKRTRVAATNARAVRRKTSKQPETPVEIFSSQETLPTGSSSSNLQASFAAQDVELGTEAFRAASDGTGVVLPLAPAADAAVVAESSSSALVPSGLSAELEERWFLALGSKIVGVQHYDGVVSDREEVVLRRQPTNMYDRNAIQVLNIRGEQIGHVPREMASLLAPVMDRFDGTELRVEGHIPRGSGNVYSIPVRLQIYGQNNPETASPSVSAAPAMLQRLGQQLQRTYCTAARGAVEVVTAPDPMGTPVQELTPEMWRQINGGKGAKKTSKLGPTMHDVINRELEEIFRQPGGYEGSPMAQQPESLKTDLYPHQLKALHWMMQQERPLTVADKLAEATAPKDLNQTVKPKRGRGGQTTGDAAQVFFLDQRCIQRSSDLQKPGDEFSIQAPPVVASWWYFGR